MYLHNTFQLTCTSRWRRTIWISTSRPTLPRSKTSVPTRMLYISILYRFILYMSILYIYYTSVIFWYNLKAKVVWTPTRARVFKKKNLNFHISSFCCTIAFNIGSAISVFNLLKCDDLNLKYRNYNKVKAKIVRKTKTLFVAYLIIDTTLLN